MRKMAKRPPEQWKVDYAPFGGGLDETSSPLSVKPGRISQSLNWEEVFGLQGYQTIKGYERYDGHASPSACTYIILPFDTGTAAIAAGDIIAGPSATALVVSITVTSGSFGGGNAAGTIIATSASGTWADNDYIKVSGATKALANGASQPGSKGYASNETALKACREALRALISKPAGEGAILGVAVYNSTVYCVRNIVGSTSATLWASSASGWTAIKTGLHASATYKFTVANFSGSSTTISLFGVSGKGRLFKVDIAGAFTYAAPIYGSEGTSTSSVTVGTGAKTFTIVEGSRSWAAADALTIWETGDTGNSMSGTVTSYTAGTNTLVMNITSVTGSGTHTDWEIGRTDLTDKPFILTEHKDHMMLGYPLGQLQTSNLGSPLTYTSTAALFGLGDDITGFSSLKGEVLGVFCRLKILLLQGSSSLDWVLGTHTKGVGAVINTVQDNAGNAMFLDDKGITTLQAVQAFGGFNAAVMSANVKTTLDANRTKIIGSRMAKASYQYRLYFNDGTMLRGTVRSGNPILMPGDISFTRQQYNVIPTCFASGQMSDGLDHMFFGTSDGYVMEEDAGTSFDGAIIPFPIRPHFNHFKSVGINKNFHKLELEINSPDPINLIFKQIMDYDDGTFAPSQQQTTSVAGTGGQFDVSLFDTFNFDLPIVSRAEASINGVGRNMTELYYFESDFVRPVRLQGKLTYYSFLEMQR